MLVKVQFTGNRYPDFYECDFAHKDTVKAAGGKFKGAAFIPAHWTMEAKAFKDIKQQIQAEKVTFALKIDRGSEITIWVSTPGQTGTIYHFNLNGNSDMDKVREFVSRLYQTLNESKQAEAIAALAAIEAEVQAGTIYNKFC